MLTYTVELQPQKEGGYTVTVPALPGCISEGETATDALANIKDAVDGYIKVLIKHKRQVPLEFSQFHQIEVFQSPKKGRVAMRASYA